MALSLYNTLTRRKEPFEPLEPGRVRMYACGITAYDECHIGHARAALVFDILLRALEFRGHQVTYVRNFTDVDDKIIARAAELGLPWHEVAARYIATYHRDMDRLGIRRPHVEPRATEHIPQMIALIEDLVRRGVAYPVDGDVYFAVARFPSYGKLSGRDPGELRAGARVEVDERKRDPLDFALWKASKPGEPTWESPWGPGRPGWHIECSAMSTHYLGDSFDIHGGGADLIFPHHENEIAQSEASTGKLLARTWIHNGFVNIRSEKMSKSLGNVLNVKDLLDRVTPEAVKLFLLGTHYRSPVDFTFERLEEAERSAERLREVVRAVEHLPLGAAPPVSEALGAASAAREEFTAALDDDLNTPRALGALFTLVREVHLARERVERSPHAAGAAACRAGVRMLEDLAGVLGMGLRPAGADRRWTTATDPSLLALRDFLRGRPDLGSLEDLGWEGASVDTDRVVDRAVQVFRAEARRRKDWAFADRLRDLLRALRVEVKDTPQGPRWEYLR
jgi:cysteinyl-tRNA synthetase